MKVFVYKKLFAGLIICFSFLIVFPVSAISVGETVVFNVEKDFDAERRNRIEAILVESSPQLYFFIDKEWWERRKSDEKDKILLSLESLASEFQNNIYPILTSIFGFERRPGIDNDERITLLFHPMNSDEGGYFRTSDGYEKVQVPTSNGREMLYLSTELLNSPKLKVALAHEFMHLITFNQKNVNFGAEEEVWLNEARADYSSTLLGYDDNYAGSNLSSRVSDFLSNPSDSLTEWLGTKYDYASVHLFTQYLVDHYGIDILADSLKSNLVGIESINYALKKRQIKEDFAQIFTNWTIASVLNDCKTGRRHCYLNQNLKNLKISPPFYFLPSLGEASFSVSSLTKNWAGNWQKFIGGNRSFKLEFSGYDGGNFVVPYILEDKNGNYTIEFLNLNENRKGNLYIEDFSSKYKSLTIIPSLQDKIKGFNGKENFYSFTFTVKGGRVSENEESQLLQQLLAQIEDLKRQIAELQARMSNVTPNNITPSSCTSLVRDLYFGISGNDVRCLQIFLKEHDKNIYPEGLVTGYFGPLTKKAVIRFQEKYKEEILFPLGLSHGTGYVGRLTRSKINQFLGGGK